MELTKLLSSKGIKVQLKNLQNDERGYVLKRNSSWKIIVNKNDPVERQNFTIVHEYFEIELYDRLDRSLDEKDNLANKLASEFHLPSDIFKSKLNTNNLLELKEFFPLVSHEVIAIRMCQFLPIVVTIFDNTAITSRFGSNNINYPQTSRFI